MGALAQVQAQAKTFSPASPLGRWLTSEVNRLAGADAAVASAAAIQNAVHTVGTDISDMSSGTWTLKVTLKNGETFTTVALAHAEVGGGANNAIHNIPTDTVDHTGGDFTLTITLKNGETFTTAAVAYNATAATLETAIDTAASGVVTGWTNGDISVAAQSTNLQGGHLELTFDGTSVSGEPSHEFTTMADSRTGGTSPSPTIVNITFGVESRINDAAVGNVAGWKFGDIAVAGGTLLAGTQVLTFEGASVAGIQQPITIMTDGRSGGTPASPLITVTTPGQVERAALSLLLNYGIITGAVAAQDAATNGGFGYTRGDPGSSRMSAGIVKALLAEAAAEDDNNSTYHAIEAALYGPGNDRANSVETRLVGDE